MSTAEAPKRERLGELLVKANLIDGIQLRVALTAQKDSGERLGTTLVALGFIDEGVLAAFLSKQADLPCINVGNVQIPREVLRLVPERLALEKSVVPVRRAGDVLYVAMADPFDTDSIRAVEQALPAGLSVTPMIAPEISLRKCLQRHYQREAPAAPDSTDELRAVAEELESDSISALGDKVDRLAAKVDRLATLVEELHGRVVGRQGAS
ncbi:MAG: hypothetical protein HY744_23040 [Deltaproteobacteria bacterium]|nr:hypothetical protein [Deltaproteobacteria bacterium]